MYVENPDKTQSSTPLVRIVVVHWNSPSDTAFLLDHLRALTYPRFEVVVVDNGSTDGATTDLQHRFPEAAFHVLPANIGFGPANNIALRAAIADNVPYAWLINSDAWPEPGALDAMVHSMERDPRIGAVGGIVMEANPPDRIQAFGGGHIFPWLGYTRHNQNAGQRLDFITGANLLLRTRAVAETGGFDERMFMYWEDTDLCFRLRAAGWKLAVAETKVWHRASGSSGRDPRLRSFHILRSHRLFLDRHGAWPGLQSLCATLVQSFGKTLRGNSAAALGCWQGWQAGRLTARNVGLTNESDPTTRPS